MRIGLIGGTGREGRGLAMRWARAGHEVFIGSRDAARAKERASELSDAGHGRIEGGENDWAVSQGEVVLLSVPYAGHAETLRGLRDKLAGKILIDITVPLKPPQFMQVHLPKGGSAALEAQEILGASTHVVAALHHVSSGGLADLSKAAETDVLVCSNDEGAREKVLGLVADLGFRGLDAGPLANAVALEALTPVLIYLGKRYKSAGPGIHVTGLP